MTLRRWWPLAALAALGCRQEAAPRAVIREPAASVGSASPVIVSVSAALPTSVSSPSPPVPPPPPPLVLTELAPTQGDLTLLLRAQVERARDKHLQPVIEFYADWCPPCRAFQNSLGDPRMIEALRGSYLVKLNLDDWHDKLDGTGFRVATIPRFYLVGPDGRPSGKMLDGDKWGKPTPDKMSVSLSEFLGHDGDRSR
jgi:thiol-disulfide isomerase/thioredoxin